jgi:GDP-4-dehydro-6-deoxy-D-mannose reductase
MKEKILITGGTGLIGSHLIEFITTKFADKYEIIATKLPRTLPYLPDVVNYIDCDFTDLYACINLIRGNKPEYIIHLGAQSYPKISESNPYMTVNSNIVGNLNIFEAIRISEYTPKKIMVTCSSASYGDVKGKYPTTEDTAFNPLSLYAVTKATQDLLSYQYFRNYELPIVRIRPYIIAGERQGENNAINSFAKQIAMIEKDGKGVLKVGNLNTFRDITDVKDFVRGLWSLMFDGENGEAYNICSGTPRKMKDILNQLVELSNADITIEVDESRLRPSDIPLEHGSNHKINTLTGWQPEIPFRDTLERILNHWRDKVESN